MVDHLEPYRQMARSIRFVPPLPLPHPSPQADALPAAPGLSAPVTRSPASIDPPDCPVDPSQHLTELIVSAVSSPTVLPPVYAVLENIGDRISRLSPDPAVAVNAWLAAQRQSAPAATVIHRPADSLAIEPSWPEPPPLEHQQPNDEPAVSTGPRHTPALDLAIEIATQAIAIQDAAAAPSATPAGAAPNPSPIADQTAPPLEAPIAVEAAASVAHWLGGTDYLTAEPLRAELLSGPLADTAIACPQCGSGELRKNGHRNGKQKYICKDCNRQFTAPAAAVPPAAPEPATPKAASSKKAAKGFGASGKSGKSSRLK